MVITNLISNVSLYYFDAHIACGIYFRVAVRFKI